MKATGEFRFDGWTLRRDSGELFRGDARVRLQRQPVQVLEALLARPGEVVTREELRALLWPTGVVDFETSLNSAVRRLRRALGDDADTPRYVETLPRRGYRFIGTLEASGGSAPAPVESGPVLAGGPPMEGAAPHSWRRTGRWIAVAAIVLLVGGGALLVRPAAAPEDAARGPAGRAAALDPETVERLRRARFFFQRRIPGDVERAKALYEQVIASRPDSAEAYAGLAGAYWILVTDGKIDRDVGLARQRAAAERALALDPSVAEAHLRLVNYAYAVGDPGMRAKHLAKFEQLAPDSAFALGRRAGAAWDAGRPDEAIELARRAVLAEPLAIGFRDHLAHMLYEAGRYDDALQVIQEAREINPDLDWDLEGRILVAQQHYEDAIATALRWRDGARRQHTLALAYHALGRSAEADAALASLIAQAGATDPLRIAEVYAWRGDRRRAAEWLDAGRQRFQGGGPGLLERGLRPSDLRHSPFAQSMSDDPRWDSWTAAGSPG